MFFLLVLAIGLSRNNSVYQLESSATVTCFSNLRVQSIIWRQNNDALIKDDSGLQQLVLDINITSGYNQTVYTCEVTFLLPNGNTVINSKSFTLNIGGKFHRNDMNM